MSHTTRVRTLVLVALFQANVPVAASESPTIELQAVVVTATRYEETAQTVPANVTVITEQDIADSTARDIPGVLKKEVGLHVYDIASNGQNYRVDRSGFGETAGLNTLVLVNGRRLNNPDLSGADWTLIPLDRVARIEVVRGARGSVLYGDNATDSVINIITKQGDGEKLNFGVEIAGGSYGTQNPSAYVSGYQNGLAYAITGRYLESDGYRDNSDTWQKDVGLSLDYSFTEAANVGLSAGYHEDHAGLPGALRESDLEAGANRRDSTNPLDFVDNQDHYVQLNPEIYFLKNSYFKAPLSYRNTKLESFASFVGGEFRANTDIDYATVSPQFVVQEPMAGYDNTLTLGFDYYSADEAISNSSLFFGSVNVGQFDLKKKNYGIYLHDEFFPSDRLALSGGYRWDQVNYEFSPTKPGTKNEADYDVGVFTTGVNYRFLDRSYVYLSFAQGFRYPVLDEIFSFFTNTINVDLVPQTSNNYEIGVRHSFTGNVYANLNLFRVDTNNEIFFNPVTFNNENLAGKTRRDGIEISAGYDLENLSISGTYTYRNAEIRRGAYSGNQVPNVPRHQASVDLVWRPLQGLTLALNGSLVGQRYLESDYANAFAKQGEYEVFNIKLKYNWKRYTAFLDLNNIFDEKYSAYGVLSTFPNEPAFYPSPEFNVLAGLRFDY
jgi:iron complex outermembrane receptor protein